MWVCLSSWEMLLERGQLRPHRVPQVLIPTEERWWIPEAHFRFISCSSPETQRSRREPMGHELCMSRSAAELAALYVILIFTSNQRIMRCSHLTNVKTGSCPKPHSGHMIVLDRSDGLCFPAILESLGCNYKESGERIFIPFEFVQRQ